MKFFKKYKELIIKILIILLISCVIGGCIFTGLYFGGVIVNTEDGIRFNVDLFTKYTNSWYGILAFILLQVIITVGLSFAPGGSLELIILSTMLFPEPWKAFIISFTGVILSSVLMYFLGRFGGKKVGTWLVGEKDYLKANELLRNKGKIYLPLLYLFPMFPDDAICLVAGMSKMNFWYHTAVVILCRGLGVATIAFGITLVPFEMFGWFDYIIFFTIVAFYVVLIFYFAHKLSQFLDRKVEK